jgi:hypothetical protein
VALLFTGCAFRYAADRLARVKNGKIGTAFHARAVCPRIAAVRRDYVAELHARAIDSDYHDALIASAHDAVARMAFFRNRMEAETRGK